MNMFLIFHFIQGDLIYEIVGDIPAPSLFKVNSRSGDIAIKTDLKTDDAFEYTVSCCFFFFFG